MRGALKGFLSSFPAGPGGEEVNIKDLRAEKMEPPLSTSTVVSRLTAGLGLDGADTSGSEDNVVNVPRLSPRLDNFEVGGKHVSSRKTDYRESAGEGG
jgi:hypothetical protein